jgi:hypothetical protein
MEGKLLKQAFATVSSMVPHQADFIRKAAQPLAF